MGEMEIPREVPNTVTSDGKVTWQGRVTSAATGGDLRVTKMTSVRCSLPPLKNVAVSFLLSPLRSLLGPSSPPPALAKPIMANGAANP